MFLAQQQHAIEKIRTQVFCSGLLNSLCATPALPPFPDYPPPTATVPGVLPAAGQALSRSATRQIVPAKGVSVPAKTLGRHTPECGWMCHAGYETRTDIRRRDRTEVSPGIIGRASRFLSCHPRL